MPNKIRGARRIIFFVMLVMASPVSAADKHGIFETIHVSTATFDETVAAVAAGLKESKLSVHVTHDVRVPGDKHRARLFVLTSPDYLNAAATEGPRTISAQVLRAAVFTWGEDHQTKVNMANPVAHAMVYYSRSDNYDTLLKAAQTAADQIRAAISDVPGEAVSVSQKPLRSERHYNKYKGDGPARMMAKFRRFEKSQLKIEEASINDFESTVMRVAGALANSTVSNESDTSGWEAIAQIPIGDKAVYFGVTNPFIENKMITINSRFRKDGKSEAAPYPGVDHMPALPAEVLIIKEGDKTLVLHYGQMWRMQLYFWDSGYRAFTANVGVPGKIAKSIKQSISAD